jgi:hypothetical protein
MSDRPLLEHGSAVRDRNWRFLDDRRGDQGFGAGDCQGDTRRGRKDPMMLHARSLKVTIVLDPGEVAALPKPRDGVTRVELRLAVAGREVTADLASKSVRRAITTMQEHGRDQVAVILQGKLAKERYAAERAARKAEARAAAAEWEARRRANWEAALARHAYVVDELQRIAAEAATAIVEAAAS